MGDNRLNKISIDVIVLMAGEGKRMRPYTKDRPKALIKCEDGLSILDHIVNSFSLPNLDVTMIPIIGHGAQKVYEEIEKKRFNLDLKCIYNPFFDKSGPLISLFLGLLNSKKDNVVIVNGDTILRPELTKQLENWIFNKDNYSNILGLCVSLTRNFNLDDMKVKISENGRFIEVGKKVIPNLTTFKSTGVFCVKGAESKKIILDKIQELLIETKSLQNNYHWHNILNEIKDVLEIDLINVDNESWFEIDTPEELLLLNNIK